MPDINVYMIDMPPSTHEAITENEDGSYSIFINDSLSPSARIESYKHAIRHITGKDFEKDEVQAIELEAHKKFLSGKAI